MGRHALLSASSSHRWLNCPPSARLCERYEDKGSEYAQEGTDAHSLCEHKLKLALGMEMILSRLVDTFSSRILNPMQFLSGNYSIAVVLP